MRIRKDTLPSVYTSSTSTDEQSTSGETDPVMVSGGASSINSAGDISMDYLDAYVYKPLTRPSQIRLLKLEVDCENFNDPIHCHLQVEDLDNYSKPSYSTLSYAWGQTSLDDSHLTNAVLCDGRVIPITASLHAALQQIRESHRVEHGIGEQSRRSNNILRVARGAIWADAICINQRDFGERTAQVALMAQIFSNSENLLIWLGRNPLRPDEEQTLSDLLDRRFGPAEMTRNLRAARHLLPLFGQSWFRRRWVVQEVLRTPLEKRFILMGPRVVSVEQLVKCLDDLGLPNVEYEVRLLGSNLREKKTMLDNLDEYDRAECFDPRDRLYALVQISKDEWRCSPNYAKTWSEVYIELAQRHIDDSSLVRLLVGAVERRIGDASDNALPTWVPNWRHPRRVRHRETKRLKQKIPLANQKMLGKYDLESNGVISVEGQLLEGCSQHRHLGVNERLVMPCAGCELSKETSIQGSKHVSLKDCSYLILSGVSIVFVLRPSHTQNSAPTYTLQEFFEDDPTLLASLVLRCGGESLTWMHRLI